MYNFKHQLNNEYLVDIVHLAERTRLCRIATKLDDSYVSNHAGKNPTRCFLNCIHADNRLLKW